MANDVDPSLWELLGIDPDAAVPPPPDPTWWNHAVQVATDPSTLPVDAELIPSDNLDLDLDPVDTDDETDFFVPGSEDDPESAFDDDVGPFTPTGGHDLPDADPGPGL